MAEKTTTGTESQSRDPQAQTQPPAASATESSTQEGAAASSASEGEGGDPSSSSTPAAEGAAEASVGAEAAPAEGEPEPKAADPAAWKAKKYDKVYAKLKEAEAKLAAAATAPAPGADGKPGLTEADVNARAAQIAELAEFNRHCNEVAASAAKTFPDFKEHIGNLRELVADEEDRVAYNQMVTVALELGDAEAGRVLYALGGNLDEANRIMAIKSQARQALELSKLAAAKGEPEPSNTPRPITPIGPKGAVGELINPADPVRADKLSKKEWFARRQADIDKRRANGERIW